jgi:hypothetical protein
MKKSAFKNLNYISHQVIDGCRIVKEAWRSNRRLQPTRSHGINPGPVRASHAMQDWARPRKQTAQLRKLGPLDKLGDSQWLAPSSLAPLANSISALLTQLNKIWLALETSKDQLIWTLSIPGSISKNMYDS